MIDLFEKITDKVRESVDFLGRSFNLLFNHPSLVFVFLIEIIFSSVLTYYFIEKRSFLLDVLGGHYPIFRVTLFYLISLSFVFSIFSSIGTALIWQLEETGDANFFSAIKRFLSRIHHVFIFSFLYLFVFLSFSIVARAAGKKDEDEKEVRLPDKTVTLATSSIPKVFKDLGPNLQINEYVAKGAREIWSATTHFVLPSIIIEKLPIHRAMLRSLEIVRDTFVQTMIGHFTYKAALFSYGTVVTAGVVFVSLFGVLVNIPYDMMVTVLKYSTLVISVMVLAFFIYLFQVYYTLVFLWCLRYEERKEWESPGLKEFYRKRDKEKG